MYIRIKKQVSIILQQIWVSMKREKRIQIFKRGFKTARDAKKAYNEFLNDYEEHVPHKNDKKITFKVFYEEYYKSWYKNQVKKATFITTTSIIENHLNYFYDFVLSEINVMDIQKFQNYMVDEYKTQQRKGLSKAYINLILANLYSIFERAVVYGLLEENLPRKVGRVREEKLEVDFRTIDEFHKVMNIIDESDNLLFFKKLLFRFLFMTGLRYGEAIALSWEDIDFQKKVIFVNKSLHVVNRKNYDYTTPKTSSSVRSVSIDEITIQQLLNWKQQQSVIKDINFIFSYDGLPLSKSTTFYWLKRLSKKAGVHDIKGHALRHSHVALLISLKEDPLVIKERLGYSKIEKTLGTYGHLYPK
ncbi:site-specific integrase [Enterococcus sp. S23]|uniref:site-specific integrase n=2 Tax=unclassified Enterococcus TaxID=2608891 RepID=UPI001CE05BDF|nr:site-specific integrase [Enterococcus sp. S23]